MQNAAKTFVLVLLTLLIFACGSSGKGDSQKIASHDPSKVLAVVNGTNITEKEVYEKLRPHLRKLETRLYKMEEAAVEQRIDEALVEQAAAKQKMSASDYLEDYFRKNVTEPTDEEIKKIYDFRKKEHSNIKYEDVKDSIIGFLKSNQQNSLQKKLISELRISANIAISLEAPRIALDIEVGPTKGPKEAPVSIIEFADFQCPHCGRVHTIVEEMLQAYPNEVRFTFKDFPLSFHKNAPKSHEAAHCAADQGKYWEMNNAIFENQRAMTIDDLKNYAGKIGLDVAAFNKCLDDGKYAKKVAGSIEEGLSLGVSETPVFLINGFFVSGIDSFDQLKKIIDTELNRKK